MAPGVASMVRLVGGPLDGWVLRVPSDQHRFTPWVQGTPSPHPRGDGLYRRSPSAPAFCWVPHA